MVNALARYSRHHKGPGRNRSPEPHSHHTDKEAPKAESQVQEEGEVIPLFSPSGGATIVYHIDRKK